MKMKKINNLNTYVLGQVDIANTLIENGADKNLGEINGLTPLHLAVHRSKTKKNSIFLLLK